MKLSISPAAAGTLILGALVGGVIGFFCGRLGLVAKAPAGSDAAKAPCHVPLRPFAAGSQESASAQRPRGGQSAKSGAATSEKLKRLDAIMQGENALDRDRALVAFIDQLAPSEFEEVVIHFRSLGITEHRLAEYTMLLTGWAKLDPEAALTFASTKIGSTYATRKILAALASSDPEAAVRWAQANHTGTSANPYLAGIIRALGLSDPAQATALLSSMPFSHERAKALDALLPNYLAKGPDATRAWIDSLPAGSLRTSATQDAAEKIAQTDPKTAADWLLANRGEATAHSLDNVLGTWALMDSPAALAYFDGLTVEEDRVNALRGIVAAIATQDPANAADLINRYPSDVTDNTLEKFVKRSVNSNPAMALDYIGQISDPKAQEQLFRKSLDSWLVTDPTAAQTWMQKNALPAKVARDYSKP